MFKAARSVRGRITLLATAVVALTLLAASLVILAMVETDLVETTERALEAELELEAASFDFDADPEFFDFFVGGQVLSLSVFVEDEVFAFGSLYDVAGIPIADVAIDLEGGEVIEFFDPHTGEPFVDPVLAEVLEELAFEVRDVDGDDGNVLLVGAVARDEVDESLGAVRDALMVTVPIFTLLMGLLIWWLVGRALQPVRAMSEQVDAISTSSLDQRVPVPQGNDEIAGLASVMNSMLSRLQRGDVRQRQFAADASHELRSPLSSVRAAAEILERNPTNPRAPQLAHDIVAEADRMDALIGDLLALSRVDEAIAAHGHVPVDLSALVNEIDDVDARPQPNITVLGDQDQLRRVLTNLVNNARRHAAGRTIVTVHAMQHDGADFAEVRVDDDGAGVPAEQRDAIFERFSRLDQARSRDRGGAGLGLALVHAIVTRHGGSVGVEESAELGGASFVVYLPMHPS